MNKDAGTELVTVAWNSKRKNLHGCQFILLAAAFVQWVRGMYRQISSCGCRYIRYLLRSILIQITDSSNITRNTIALSYSNFLFCMALVDEDIIN